MEELLVPRHPLDSQHQAQMQALQAMPEQQRAKRAQLFRFGNATYHYHDWREGLPVGDGARRV